MEEHVFLIKKSFIFSKAYRKDLKAYFIALFFLIYLFVYYVFLYKGEFMHKSIILGSMILPILLYYSGAFNSYRYSIKEIKKVYNFSLIFLLLSTVITIFNVINTFNDNPYLNALSAMSFSQVFLWQAEYFLRLKIERMLNDQIVSDEALLNLVIKAEDEPERN